MTVSVLVVEDEPGFLQRFCDAIAAEPVLRLCGAGTTVVGACALLDTLSPDVVLVDLGLPDGNGVDVIRHAMAGGAREDTKGSKVGPMRMAIQLHRFSSVSGACPEQSRRMSFVFKNHSSSSFNTAMNASCGISTFPTIFKRFLPFFCFSSNFFLRVISPP